MRLIVCGMLSIMVAVFALARKPEITPAPAIAPAPIVIAPPTEEERTTYMDADEINAFAAEHGFTQDFIRGQLKFEPCHDQRDRFQVDVIYADNGLIFINNDFRDLDEHMHLIGAGAEFLFHVSFDI